MEGLQTKGNSFEQAYTNLKDFFVKENIVDFKNKLFLATDYLETKTNLSKEDTIHILRSILLGYI